MSALPAFFIRDWRIRSHYRASWFLGIGHLLFSITAFFFVGQLVKPGSTAALAPYGGSYFPFAFFGLLAARLLTVSLSSVSGNLREEQLQGTLEAVLSSPLRLPTLVIGTIFWDLLMALAEVTVALAIGVMIFGVDISRMNVPASLAVAALTIASLSGFGVLSASAVLILKDFDPTSWVFDGLMKLASGVFVPVALLPSWLQLLARLFPMTYGLEGLRQAALMGKPLSELSAVCAELILFAVIIWPVSLLALSWALNHLKATGQLSFR